MRKLLATLAVGLLAVTTTMGQQGLTLRYYAGQHSTALVDPISNLLALTPTSTRTFTGAISFGDPSASLGTQAENYTVLWTGWFVAPTAGTYTFQTGSDDGSLVYLDLDGDGVFETGNSPSERIVNNNFYQGVNYRDGTVTLAAQAYRIAIPFYQGGGGEGMYANYKLPGDSSYRTVNTADGRFFVNVYPFDIATAAASSVGQTAATLNGVMSIFNESDFDVWAAWSTNDWGEAFAAWQANGAVESIGEQAAGAFAHPVTGLASNTTYYYRFFATNDAHSAWSDTAASFKTLGAIPAVDNASGATGIGGVRALLNGRLTGGSRADCRIYLGTTDGGWTQGYDFGSQLEGAFSVNAGGLALDTTYYYRTFASNDYGVAWSPTAASFTTAATSAETLIWNGASGNNWNDSTKWLPNYGIYPQANDTAVLSNHVAGGTINLNGNQAVYRLDIGTPAQVVADNLPDYVISGHTLRLGAGGIHFYGRWGQNTRINSAVELTADSSIWQHSVVERDKYVNGAIDNAGYTLTLQCDARALYIDGPIAGAGAVRTAGGSTAAFRAANAFTGAFAVGGGNAMLMSGGTMLTAGDVRVTSGATLTLGDTGSTVSDNGATTFGRIANAQNLLLWGAGLNMRGQSAATVERLGEIQLIGGRTWIDVQRATLIPAALTRDASSRPVAVTMSSDYNLGAGSYLKPTDGGAGLTQIGGDGSRTTNKKVVPYLTTRTSGSTYEGNPNSFVTYDAANGLVQMNPASDFVQGASTTDFPTVDADGNDNVRLPYTAVHPTSADTTVSVAAGNTAINSLIFDGNYTTDPGGNKLVTLTGPAGSTLTVKSGALMCTPSGGINNAGRGTKATISVPTLAFGSAEGVINCYARDYVTFKISSAITGNNGLTTYCTAGGSGDTYVSLAGDNSGLTGQITISGAGAWGGPTKIESSVTALGSGANDLFLNGTLYNDVGVTSGQSVTVKTLKGFGTLIRRYSSASINVGGAGTGGAANTLTLLAGGAVQPGTATRAGTLTVQDFSAVKLSGGALELDLFAATDYDRLALTGTPALTLNGASILPVLHAMPTLGEQYLVVTVAGSTGITGKFAQQDSVEAVYGNRKVAFDIFYNSSLAGGTGNDVVLRVASIRPASAGTVVAVR